MPSTHRRRDGAWFGDRLQAPGIGVRARVIGRGAPAPSLPQPFCGGYSPIPDNAPSADWQARNEYRVLCSFVSRRSIHRRWRPVFPAGKLSPPGGARLCPGNPLAAVKVPDDSADAASSLSGILPDSMLGISEGWCACLAPLPGLCPVSALLSHPDAAT